MDFKTMFAKLIGRAGTSELSAARGDHGVKTVYRLAPGDAPGVWQPSIAFGRREYSEMRLGTAYACARLLATTVASLPMHVYERSTDGSRQLAAGLPLYSVLHVSPNADQTSFDYQERLMLDLMFAGDHIAEKQYGAGGKLIGLMPLDARSVTVKRAVDGSRQYSWHHNGQNVTRGEADVFHVRAFGGDDLRGQSIVSYGADTLARASATDRAAHGVFSNGIRPSGVFEMPDGQFLTPEQHADFMANVAEEYVGAHRGGRPMLLQGGLKFAPISMSNDDAQLLESRGYSVEEICRLFGVPPFMVGHSEKSTSWGTGIEQQMLAWLKTTLTPYLRRIEMAIAKQLIDPADRARVFAEFSIDGLLRSDSKARSEFYQKMTQLGAMTINEVRRLENLPPVAGGDVPRVQMQNVPLGEAGDNGVQP